MAKPRICFVTKFNYAHAQNVIYVYIQVLAYSYSGVLFQWGPMAHILHAGGPWKLESPCRSRETGVNMEARQANKVPGGWWGSQVIGSLVSLPDGLGPQTSS